MEGVFFTPPLTTIAYAMCLMAGLLGGALGPGIVWNRLGLLGDTISHSSLSVMAIGLILGLPEQSLLIPFSVALGLGLALLRSHKILDTDSVLAVVFSGMMGVGLLLMSATGVNPTRLLFLLAGDLSSAQAQDLFIISVWTLLVIFYLMKFRKELRLITLQADLATIQGVRVKLHQTLLLVLICVSVAICVKLMGVILVTALFVTPALIARQFSTSASGHALLSIAFGLALSGAGLALGTALKLHVPPTIAALGLGVFALSSAVKRSS